MNHLYNFLFVFEDVLSAHWQEMAIPLLEGPMDFDEVRGLVLTWVETLSGLLFGAVAAVLLVDAWSLSPGAGGVALGVVVVVVVVGSLLAALGMQSMWLWAALPSVQLFGWRWLLPRLLGVVLAALLLISAWNLLYGVGRVAVVVVGSLLASLLLQFACTWIVKRRRIQRMSEVAFTLFALSVSLILAASDGVLVYWYLTQPGGSLGLVLTGIGGGLVVLFGLIWRDMRYW